MSSTVTAARPRPTTLRSRLQPSRPPVPPAHSERVSGRWRVGVLAAVAYLPLLASRPGQVIYDTADVPFVDPDRAMGLAASRWDPTAALGTISDRSLDAGFPLTPWFWLTHHLHLPTWIAQRIWLGSLLFVAGLGVYSLMKALRWIGPGRVTAAVAYVATPYLLTGFAGRSVIFLAWAGLPWLIADTIRSLENPGWRYPARFGVVVAVVGRSHLPSLIYVLIGPGLWIVSSIVATREVNWRDALKAVGRMTTVSLATSAWWLIAISTDPRVMLADLRAADLADATRDLAIVDIVRGVADPTAGPFNHGGGYASVFVFLGYLIPAIALTALCKVRFRNRLFVVALIVVGIVVTAGSAPLADPEPYGRFLSRLVSRDVGALVASSVRGFPLVTLGMAIGFGAGTRALTQFRRARSPVVETAAALLALASVPTLLFGQLLDSPLRHRQGVPDYWRQLADELAPGDERFNVLELPGLDETMYNWGTTNSPVSTSLLSRAVGVRTTQPPSEAGTYDMISSFDRRLREGTLEPQAIAPLARLMGADTIVVRNDRPGDATLAVTALDLLDEAPGISPRPSLGPIDQFPPPLSVYAVDRPLARDRVALPSDLVVVAGSAMGLIDLANAGLLTGDEVIAYASSFDTPEELRSISSPSTRFVVTDSQRWDAQSVDSFVDSVSFTGSPEWPLPSFPGARQISAIEDARPGSSTTVDYFGANTIVAGDVPGVSSHIPVERVANAFDGDPTTAWTFGAAVDGEGARVTIRLDDPLTTSALRIAQPAFSPRVRSVAVTFDGYSRVVVATKDVGDASVVEFPAQQTTSMTIEIVATDPAPKDARISISDIDIEGVAAIEEQLVLPSDLVRLAPAVQRNPLTISLTRWRDAAGRPDPEQRLVRSFVIPDDRTLTLTGVARSTSPTTPASGCRSDLVSVDDNPVRVRLSEVEGRAGEYQVSGCDGALTLDTGSHTVRTAASSTIDVAVDQLLLAEETSGRPVQARPTISIDDPRPTSFAGSVDSSGGDFWLVHGVSNDPGWTATLDQVELDQGTLVNGFAKAWPVDITDDKRHFVSVRMSSQRTINIAVLVSSVAALIAAGLGFRRSRDRWTPAGQTPDSLRAINSIFVVLVAVGVFSVAAGPLPGLAAGLAALGMEHRASLQRTIGWVPLPLILGIGLVRSIHETISDAPPENWWGSGSPWPNGLAWIAVAIAVTTALVNSERRPARALVV